MTKPLAQLASRRLELLANIEDQRADLAYLSVQLQRPLAVVDAGWKVVSLIHKHPALVTGTLTALITWRRKGFLGLAKHGWRLLLLYPSAIFLGLKYLSTETSAPDKERDKDILQ
jgi:hypothetical protein